MRHLVVALLVALLAAPALASHGAYVRTDSITSTYTGYATMNAHRFLVDLNPGDRIDVALETLDVTRSVYAVDRGHAPRELGLTLYMPGGGSYVQGLFGLLNPSCSGEEDPFLSDETKRRSGVATTAGKAVVYVSTELIAPAGNAQYRLTITVNDHEGAARVAFYGPVQFTYIGTPVCRLFA